MDKNKLKAQLDKLEARAEALLCDETREFSDDDKKTLDAINDKMDSIVAMLGREDSEEVKDEDKEEDKDKEDKENSFRAAAPAVLRSRGRQSVDNIHQHASREGYSLTRAALNIAEGRSLRGVEAEVQQELTRNGSSRGSLRIPFDQRALMRRDLTTSTGAGAIPVYTDGSNFVEWLFPKLIGPQLGFNYMPGLKAGTKLPRTSSVPTVQAVAEQGSATGSAPGIDYVQLNPHTLTAFVTISKLFAQQSVVAADRYVMQNGSSEMAVQLDQWAITGSGSSDQPAGLLNNSAFTQHVISASNTLAYGDVLDLEKFVQKANANFGPNQKYLTSPAGNKTGMTTPKLGSTFPVFVIDDGKINGKEVIVSSQVPDNLTYSATNNLTSIIYGNWEYLVVAMFGDDVDGIDVIVDPFTGSTAGDLRITFLMLADTNILRPTAFAAIPNCGYA